MASESVCPFTLPTFECALPSVLPTLDPIDIEQVKSVVANPDISNYLNIAAPFVQILPQHIKTLGTFGDSISAGLFISSTAWDLFRMSSSSEKRRYSWSSGGAELDEIFTVYNAFKHLNPNLQGGSTGFSGRRWVPTEAESESGLNMAVSSTQTDELPRQADAYNKLIAANDEWSSSWKMVNVLIGANDICRSCETNQTESESVLYERHIRATLEALEQNPNGATKTKMLVNLFGIPDLTPLRTVGADQGACKMARNRANICSCVLGEIAVSDETLKSQRLKYNDILKAIALEYQKKYLQSIIDNPAMNPWTNSFLVYYQPAFVDIDINKTRLSVLSSIDCFHLSHCGHQMLAYSTFNSMFAASDVQKRKFVQTLNDIVSKRVDESGTIDGSAYQIKKLPVGGKAKVTFHDSRSLIVDQGLYWSCPAAGIFIK